MKAIAVYRDGSKRTQPLSTKKDEGKNRRSLPGDEKAAAKTTRVSTTTDFPTNADAVTHKFSISGHEGYITVGLYEDGTPGEIFITMSKEGSTISGLMDGFATAISLALQYGVPLKVLVDKFSHMRFEPSGFTNNKEVPIAKSVLDYIFRWMGLKFLAREDQPASVVIDSIAAEPKAEEKKRIQYFPGTNGEESIPGTSRCSTMPRVWLDHDQKRFMLQMLELRIDKRLLLI